MQTIFIFTARGGQEIIILYYLIMWFLQKIIDLIKEDVEIFTFQSGDAIRSEHLLRLLIYLAVVIYTIMLFFPHSSRLQNPIPTPDNIEPEKSDTLRSI